MKNLIEKFSAVSCKYNKLILLFAILLLVISGLISSGLTMDSSMENLLPDDSKIIASSKSFESEFGSQDSVLVAVKGTAATAEEYMEKLALMIKNDDIAVNIFYKADSKSLKKYAPLYIPKDAYLRLSMELDNPESYLSRFLNAPDLSSMTNLFLSRLDGFPAEDREEQINNYAKILVPADSKVLTPDKYREFYGSLIFGYFDKSSLVTDSNYLVSDSGHIYLMIIKPRVEMDNFVESRERFFSTLKKDMDSLLDLKEFSGIEAGFTGGTFVQDYEADMVAFQNFYSTALFTFILILGLIIISFRRFLIPLASGLPLLLGTLLAAALIALTYKSINLFSISFAALLLGLGIDFAIHMTARYQEERSKGLNLASALANMLKSTGMGMFIGALTTAVAFLAFSLAEFKAFTQMGVIIGAGIILSLLTMFFVMPSVIAFFDGGKKIKRHKDVKFSFLVPVGRLAGSHPWAVIGICMLLLAILFVPVSGTKIVTDMSAIYPDNMTSTKWLKIIEEEFDYNPDTLSLMADNIDELKSWTELFKKTGSIKKIESILDFMPQDQDFKLETIHKVLSKQKSAPLKSGDSLGSINSTVTQEYYKQAVGSLRSGIAKVIDKAAVLGVPEDSHGIIALKEFVKELNSSDAYKYLEALQKNIGQQQELIKSTGFENLQPVTINHLPKELTLNYMGKTGKFLVEVLPNGDIWDDKTLKTFNNDIYDITETLPVGMPVIMNEIVGMVKKDVVKISSIAFIIIFLLLLITFRSIKVTFITLLPVILTLYFMLGFARLLRIEINIISLMAFPLIIGIGIDSGVHIIHRLKEDKNPDITNSLVNTGKAVIMTTLTTLIGFGSFMFANHPGLSSMGKTVVLGMSICLLLSLTLLPSLHVLLIRKPESKARV